MAQVLLQVTMSDAGRMEVETYSPRKYYSFFEDRFGQRWVLVLHRMRIVGELRGDRTKWWAVQIDSSGLKNNDLELSDDVRGWLDHCLDTVIASHTAGMDAEQIEEMKAAGFLNEM